MRTSASRTGLTAMVLTVCLAASACGVDAASPAASEAREGVTPAAASSSPDGAAASSVAPTPAGGAVFGEFRRGGVPIPPDLARRGEDECRTSPVPDHAEEIGTRPLVVSDTRGLGVMLFVFADGKGATGCRVEVDEGAGAVTASHFAITAGPDGELERGQITLGAMEYVEEGPNQRAVAVGRVGEGAVKVRAGFDDDTYVTSTIANGWYAMWWPGRTRAAVIVAADNRNVAMGKLTPP